MKVRTRTIVPIHPISGRLARESSYLTASQLLLSFARLLFCHCHPPPCILIDTHALFESVFSTRRQWYIQTGLDSQLPSLISLYVFVWSISEANPKNNWTRLTYNCAHLRSTKESLTDSVKKFFVRKFFCVKIFLGENLLGEHFLSEHFFWGEIFWGKIFLSENFGWNFCGWYFFGWTFFWVKIFGWKFFGWNFFWVKILGEKFFFEIFFV